MIPALLPWHEAAWRRVIAQAAAGRFPHAMLISSAPGTGGDRFAARLAAHWLCTASDAAMRPCGDCQACHLFGERAHADCLQLQPEAAGRVIPVDEVRRTGRFAAQSSLRGAASVIWIEPADAMNLYAANALLKTLEEPREGVYLLLSTCAPGRLLPTIRSRCQALVLPAPDRTQSRNFLAAHITDPDAVEPLLALTGCAPLAALAMHEDGLLPAHQGFAAALERLGQGRVSVIDAVAAGAELPLPEVLDALYRRLRDQLAGQRQAAAARYYDRLLEARRAVFSASNPNRELLLEALLIEWPAHATGRNA